MSEGVVEAAGGGDGENSAETLREGAEEDQIDANEAGEEEEGHGVREIERLLDPKLPAGGEVKEHVLAHLPYRNWRPTVSMAGRGR